MKKLGIDIGSLYLGAVLIDEDEIRHSMYCKHNGNILDTLQNKVLQSSEFKNFDALGLTGKVPRSLTLDNTLCHVEGAKWLVPGVKNVFILGGETFTLVRFNTDSSYLEHSVNPPCASGTGAFIEQQAERIAMEVETLAEKAASFTEKTPAIATRCAVFAKTDIIHAMQEGYSKEAVATGLCEGIARSIVDNLVKGREIISPAAVLGGVSLNQKVIHTLSDILGAEVLTPAFSHLSGAIGAALLGTEKPGKNGQLTANIESLFKESKDKAREKRPPLPHTRGETSQEEAFSYHIENEVEIMLPRELVDISGGVFIGIDIGSTSTKAAVLTESEVIAGGVYTSTGGDPIDAVKKCIRSLINSFSLGSNDILGLGTTGSGRKLIKELFDADLAVNEITAHARAATYLVADADTIIEIGGQDSKFTRLKDGEVYFSKMNYVCAAGTGSFIEEQAKRLNANLEDFSNMAYGSEAPFTSDRCTVYMERDIHALLGEGWTKNSLAAAVLHSVRDNYLAKVVGKSPLGDRIVFQGATGRNKALVSSFEDHIGKPIYVSPYCHLTGAIGAALLCKSSTAGNRSGFTLNAEAINFTEEICDRCSNRCLLTVAEKNGVVTGWGMKCGKEYADRGPIRIMENCINRRFKKAMAPLERTEKRNKGLGKTVAVPEVLYNALYAPLWKHFLSSLGFAIQPPVKERTSLAEGKRVVNSDFCAPITLAHGTFSKCLQNGADFIFFPSMVNEVNPGQQEHLFKKKTTDAYFCYYSQYLPSMITKCTGLDMESKLISPLLLLNSQTEEEIIDILYRSLSEHVPDIRREEIKKAYTDSYKLFNKAQTNWAGTYTDQSDPERLEIVVVGRPYIAMDRALHLDIPQKCEALGAKVFWQDEIDLSNFEAKYAGKYLDRMHWQFGKQILKCAEFAGQRPNLFPVFITSFRCSPDSFILTYFQDIMEQHEKPFLILQVDEHSSSVGYETRIEAGITSFTTYLEKQQEPHVSDTLTEPRDDALEPGDTVFLPYLDACISTFWANCFEQAGYETVLLENRDEDLITGYKYTNGGECMPLTALIGGVIQRLQREEFPKGKCFFYIPTVCMACNFPQYPILADLAFQRAGYPDIKIGLINNMSPGEILPQSLSIKMLESNIIGGILHKCFFRIHPYETEPGMTKIIFNEERDRISKAILEGKDLRKELTISIERFGKISRNETGGRRPKIGLIGDLYVKFNALINQNIQEVIDDLGGELIIPSLTEYPFHFYDADVRLYGDNPRQFKLLRTVEQRYEKIAADIIGDQLEPDFSECVKLMEEYNIRHYIAGETSINVGRALYYCHHHLVDAIVHINPIFCCPGVVTSSIYRKMQEDFGIPIIDIFYDGAGRPNDVLIPHLHYLKERLFTN